MQTATIEKTETMTQPIAEEAKSQGEVATFKPPRLPWHDAIHQRFPAVDRGSWKALVEAIYPNAKSVDSVILALTYCKARNLDPFKRPVHIVPMWDTKAGAYCETIWPGISELRTTAFRTKQYAGCDAAEFGPTVEREFTGEMWENKKKIEKTIKLKFPEWARITIYRALHGTVCKFVGPKVLWIEAYAAVGKSDLPNDMWRERTEGQLEKCAEAAALRRAFPEELGNEYAAEEMEGRRKMVDVTEAAKALAQTPATEPAKAGEPEKHPTWVKLAEAAKASGEPAQKATIAEAMAAAATSEPINGQGQPTTDGAPDLDFETDGKPSPTSAVAKPAGAAAVTLASRQTPAAGAVSSAVVSAEPPEAQVPLDGDILPPEKTRTKDDIFLEYADRALGAVTNPGELETVWNDKIVVRIDEVSKDRQAEVYAVWRKHEIRLGID